MQPYRMLSRLTPLCAVLTLPLGILAGLFYGLTAALVVFVVGWLLLTPASAILFGEPDDPGPLGDSVEEEVQEHVQQRVSEKLDAKLDENADRNTKDPVEELRDRYARGEIDEVELERRLDTLLEMEEIDPNDEEDIERVKRNLDTQSKDRSTASRKTDTETGSGSGELELDRE